MVTLTSRKLTVVYGVRTWCRQLLRDLNLFEPHNRAGGLVFDEIKIQEGLVWEKRTDRIVGFVEGHFLDTEAQVLRP